MVVGVRRTPNLRCSASTAYLKMRLCKQALVDLFDNFKLKKMGEINRHPRGGGPLNSPSPSGRGEWLLSPHNFPPCAGMTNSRTSLVESLLIRTFDSSLSTLHFPLPCHVFPVGSNGPFRKETPTTTHSGSWKRCNWPRFATMPNVRTVWNVTPGKRRPFFFSDRFVREIAAFAASGTAFRRPSTTRSRTESPKRFDPWICRMSC